MDSLTVIFDGNRNNALAFTPSEKVEQALVNCSAELEKHGLSLSKSDIAEITSANISALKKTGRLELGEGIAPELARVFCSSPFINDKNFTETLCELTYLFYEFKNESDDMLSDNEMLDLMKCAFDGVCGGSTHALASDVIPELTRRMREKKADGDFAFSEANYDV